MVLSRSVMLGLCGAAVVFFTNLWSVIDERSSAGFGPPPVVAHAESISVVDVARGADPAALATFIRLRGDERVVAVGDRAVASDLAAGAEIAAHPVGSGRFLDLTVRGAEGSRRVLVLVH
ncbi:MAG: hypothetical protein H0X17_03490 [Deltaproteobacteria bacterium]|nr:hypothetical protein [Deltaproteobacteria bacterium]